MTFAFSPVGCADLCCAGGVGGDLKMREGGFGSLKELPPIVLAIEK